jgi:hypothetical protein
MFRTAMRTLPSVSVDTIGNLRLSDGTAVVTTTSVSSLGGVGGSSTALIGFVTSGLTQFRPYFVEANGTLNSAKITFSSEL